MRALAFKLAGVKNDKEFYKLFPDEASFMKKHGKAFKKAADGGFMDKMGGVAGLTSSVSNLAGGISEALDERKQVKVTEQNMKVAGINAEAMAMIPEKIENEYVRPEDIENSGDEFYPVYGVGRGGLVGQDGANFFGKRYGGEGARYGNGTGAGNFMRNVFNPKSNNISEEDRFKNRLRSGDFKSYGIGQNGDYIPKAQNYGEMWQDNYNEYTQPQRPFVQGVNNNMIGTNSQQLANVGNPVGVQVGQKPKFKMEEKDWNNAGELASKLTGGTKNAGGTLGKAAGSIVGNFVPIPGASQILGFAGEKIGQALDKNAKKIEDNVEQTERYESQMFGMGVGSKVQQRHNATVQDGKSFPLEEAPMDGKLKTHWGGRAETISYNPAIPGGGETVEFYGEPHNGSNVRGQSGIGVSMQDGGQANASLEVEDGEVATKFKDKVIVYGNLPITKTTADKFLGDPMAANKKVKNYAKGISENVETSNKALKKNAEMLADLDVRTSFDKTKLKGLEAMKIGHDMRLKIGADKMKNVGLFQDAVTETADKFGIVANDLARGKVKVDKGNFVPSNATTAQYGAEIPIAQDDGKIEDEKKTFTTEQIPNLKKEGWIISDDGKTATLKGTAESKKLVKDATEGSNEESTTKGGKIIKTYENQMSDADWKEYLKNETPEQKKKRYAREQREGYRTKAEKVITKSAVPATPAEYETIPGTPDQNMYLQDATAEDEEEKKKFGLGDAMGIANGILPYVRPSDQDDFDYSQLYGEMYALSHNKLEPVKAQKFDPRFKRPYKVSFQDQRNQVTAATRAASKFAGYNPAAQAMIAQQSYEPLNKINADEFRENQAMEHKIYGENTDTVNAANITNLGILDQQAERQSIARSNTKEATQLALNSGSEKKLQHKLENSSLAYLENLYNYRFGANKIAQNMNPLAQFNMQGSPGAQAGSLGEQILYGEERLKEMKKYYKQQRDAAGNTYEGYDYRNTGYAPPGTTQDGGVLKKIPLVRALKGYNN